LAAISIILRMEPLPYPGIMVHAGRTPSENAAAGTRKPLPLTVGR